ncbi:Threonine/homoserine efflux transporter RhtA [Alicyclobacillus hesperidum]|uniref:Threonine/homoserine efflux transporter RhtA n=1 Tax=Alicyclobacillus hesperidum TaxID=89784 RepID=A0A1H2U3C3_9BACL|nr:Threonine/homoserine efflux transporter RhtA [Alicyclobacillus hesperidum]
MLSELTTQTSLHPDVVSDANRFKRLKGLFLALLGAVLWGVSGTAAQVLFQRHGVAPGWLVAVRMTIAGFLLVVIVGLRKGWASVFAPWRNLPSASGMLVFGLVGLLGVQYTYFAAIGYGNAATATILQYLSPLVIVAYGALRSRRLPSGTQFFCLALALVGSALLVTDGRVTSLSIAPLAVVWGLASAFAVSFYSIYPQRLLAQFGAAATTGWGMLVGGVMMSIATVRPQTMPTLPIGAWGLVVFVVLFGTLLAFYLYMVSLRYIEPAEASLLACGEPLSASILALTVLHVQMGPVSICGGLCVLLTVSILARSRK